MRVQTTNGIRTTDGKQYRKSPLFQALTTTRGIGDTLRQDATLKSTYETVHALRSALKKGQWLTFQRTLETALQGTLPKGVKRVLKTFKKYQGYIEQTLTYRKFTNGPI